MEDVKEAARRAVGTLDTIAKTLDDSAHPEAAIIRKMAAKESADLLASLEPAPGVVVDAAAREAITAKAEQEQVAAKAKADQDERDRQAADAERMRQLQADMAKRKP